MLLFVLLVETLSALIEVKNATSIPVSDHGHSIGKADVYPEWSMTIEECQNFRINFIFLH